MNNSKFAFALALGLPLLLLPCSAPAVERYLSESELHALFPGQFRAVVYGLLRLKITVNANGTLFAQQPGKTDTGIWAVRSGKLCIRFSKWLKRRTSCSTVSERGGWYRTASVAFRRG